MTQNGRTLERLRVQREIYALTLFASVGSFLFSYDFTTIEGDKRRRKARRWEGGWSHRRWNFPGFDGVDNDDVVAIAKAVVFYVACHKSENIMKLVRNGGTMKQLRNCRQSISKVIYEAVFDLCNWHWCTTVAITWQPRMLIIDKTTISKLSKDCSDFNLTVKWQDLLRTLDVQVLQSVNKRAKGTNW